MSSIDPRWRAARAPFPPLSPFVRNAGMQHTLVALVQDRPGTLNRAVSLFRRRGMNIESLTVSQTEHTGISRMTWVVLCDDVTPVIAQLEKLIDVLEVYEVPANDAPSSAPPARGEVPRSMFSLSQADGIA